MWKMCKTGDNVDYQISKAVQLLGALPMTSVFGDFAPNPRQEWKSKQDICIALYNVRDTHL